MRKTMNHSLSSVPEYRIWQSMRARCIYPTCAAYKNYGGRGITVCDRWLNSPSNFIEDMGSRPSDKHQLDRINNDLGYFKENCRWVTSKTNNRNRRNNVLIEFNGETRSVAEWAELLGINAMLIYGRIKRGMPIEKVLTTPPRFLSAHGHSKSTGPCITCGIRVNGVQCKNCRAVDPSPITPCGKPQRTREEILEIRSATGTYKEVAARFGISPVTVGQIKRRYVFKHVPDEPIEAARAA